MKVSLIHCGNCSPIDPTDIAQKNIFYMPMGMIALANLLKKQGFEVDVLHSDLQNPAGFESFLDLENTDVIGFDLHWINQSKSVIDTALAIKEKKPEIFIFIGGFSASFFHQEILEKYRQIDGVIRGDAEKPIISLCNVLHKIFSLKNISFCDTELYSIPNLTWRSETGVIVNDLTYTVTENDLDELDFSKLECLKNWEFYVNASHYYSHFTPIRDQSMFLLELGRGCEYNCLFCGGNSVAQHLINNRKKVIFRSVTSVLNTITKAYTYGYRTFYLSLENKDSEKWYFDLFRQLESKYDDLSIGFGAWSLPSKQFVDRLSACSNQAVIEISPESGNEEVRRMNKDSRISFSNEEMEEWLTYVRQKKNLKVQIFFGYYLFGDTTETIIETIRYISYLICKYEGFIEIEYANFSTDPASLFYLKPEKYGMGFEVKLFEDYLNNLNSHFYKNTNVSADLTLFKPENLCPGTDTFLRELIGSFNLGCTSFKLTFSYLNKRYGKFTVVINCIIDICIKRQEGMTLRDIKNEIINYCNQSNINDEIISKLIEYEQEMFFSKSKVSKPTTQLYFDYFELNEVLTRFSDCYTKKNTTRVETSIQEESGDFNF